MKFKLLVSCLLMVAPTFAIAQRIDPGIASSWSVSLDAGHFGDDGGVGFSACTAFYKNRIALQATYRLLWLDATMSGPQAFQQSQYKDWSLDILVVSNFLNKSNMRFFGNIGPDLLRKNHFASRNAFAIHALAGLEFFLLDRKKFNISYHVGLGYMHSTSHTTTRVDQSIPYGTGGMVVMGLRTYFPPVSKR